MHRNNISMREMFSAFAVHTGVVRNNRAERKSCLMAEHEVGVNLFLQEAVIGQEVMCLNCTGGDSGWIIVALYWPLVIEPSSFSRSFSRSNTLTQAVFTLRRFNFSPI